MSDYTRPGRIPFTTRGVDVNTPIDLVRTTGKFPALKNVIVGTDGTIEPRPGTTNRYASYAAIAGKSPVHSIRRLNDTSSGTLIWSMMYGVQDVIALEQSGATGTLVLADSGYSTSPLSLIVYRPPRAVQPWMYVGDSSRQRKLRYNAPTASILVHNIGLPAPNVEPVTAVSTGTFKEIDLFNRAGVMGWTTVGGAIIGPVFGNRVNTTLTATAPFEAFGAADQICVVRPASMANIGVGMILNVQTGAPPAAENVLVSQVNKGSATFTILRILYDAGTTGLCSIVMSASIVDITVNSLLWDSTTNKYARVQSVNYGPSGSMSVRVNTVTTWTAGDSIASVPSFVCHPLGGVVSASPLTAIGLKVTVPGGATAATFDRIVALDLSNINPAPGAANQASTLDDYIDISILSDSTAGITEMKIMFDVDATTNDFAHNYYYRALTPSDLIPVTTGAQSALDNRRTQISRRVIDHIRHPRIILDPGGGGPSPTDEPANDPLDPSAGDITTPETITDPATSRSQLGTGVNQWAQIRFRLSDMQRIGTDDTRGFKDVAAIRISVLATLATVLFFDSFILDGGSEPDVADIAAGYQYAYRARASSTGVVSDISPLSRGPANAHRQNVAVALPQYTAAAEADYLDVIRIGGSLTTASYVGSVANSATPIFIDRFSDTSVFASSTAGGTFDIDDPDLALWPTVTIPITSTTTGATATVAGTTVLLSGAVSVLPSLAPGVSLIVIDGIPTTIYRVISTTQFEISDSLGSRTSAAWTLNEPVLLNQTLPVLFGPFHDHLLAVGDPRNAGSLYWTKAKNVDSTSLRRRLEITDNSDPLMNGFVFNGRGGVFSSQLLYYLEYDGSDPISVFSANATPNVKGLYARWAMAVGRRGVVWLASDGVYITAGDGAKSLTDTDLRPLFPLGGKQGADTNGVSAPFMPSPVGAEERFLRLSFDENDNLRFVYRDSSANMRCMLYDFSLEGWLPFVYKKPVSVIYSEEGQGVRNLVAGTSEATGRVLTIGGSADNYTDDGTAPDCRALTSAYDFSDPRSRKQIGDIEIDTDPSNATLTVTPGFDNNVTTTTPVTITGSARLNPPTLIDFSSGSGQFARNVCLDITWANGANQKPKLYLWEPSYLIHPEDTLLRATDYDFDQGGMSYVRGLWFDADTAGVPRTVLLEYINYLGAVTTFSLTVTHPVKSQIYYPISLPFYASTLRVRPTDSAKWKLYGYKLDSDPAPPFSTEATAFTEDGDQGAKFLQGCRIRVDTHGTAVSYQVQGDNGVVLTTITGISSTLPAVVPRAFNPAVRTHLMRLVPLQSAHTFSVEWDWQSDSEFVDYYESQESSFDIAGYKHVRELFIAYAAATAPLTLALTADGVPIPGIPVLPISASYVRYRIMIPATKCRALQATLSSSARFRLYSRDCAVYVKAWGSDGDYQPVELFGTMHRDRGIAKI